VVWTSVDIYRYIRRIKPRIIFIRLPKQKQGDGKKFHLLGHEAEAGTGISNCRIQASFNWPLV